MLIKLFELNNGKVMPTEHCYIIKFLKDIMECFPDNHLKIYAYLFYMTCPNSDLNPFMNVKESDKEEIIYANVEGDFSLEDPIITNALEQCKKLYETAGYRAYIGMKEMLDKLSDYMRDTPIEHGRDGNINSLIMAGKNFSAIKEAFNKSYNDLQKEQMRVRGGRNLGYDQRPGGDKSKDEDLFKDFTGDLDDEY